MERNPHLVGAFRRAYVNKLAVVAQEPQLLSVAIVFFGAMWGGGGAASTLLNRGVERPAGSATRGHGNPRNAAAELPDWYAHRGSL